MKECKLIDLPKIVDHRGNLSFVESHSHIPFKIARSYWIYDVPDGGIRGGHSYRTLEEFVIALSGSFEVIVNNGDRKQEYRLNRPHYGLYIPSGIWRHIENFSTNAVCLILASDIYRRKDYVLDLDDFKNSIKYK